MITLTPIYSSWWFFILRLRLFLACSTCSLFLLIYTKKMRRWDNKASEYQLNHLAISLLAKLLFPSSSLRDLWLWSWVWLWFWWESSLGLTLSIPGVVPVLLPPIKWAGISLTGSNHLLYSLRRNLVSAIWFPIVNHPFLMLLFVPNSYILFLPRQKRSMIS